MMWLHTWNIRCYVQPRKVKVTCGGQSETQLESIQVAHGTLQKFELEICQNLIHTLAWCCGSGLDVHKEYQLTT